MTAPSRSGDVVVAAGHVELRDFAAAAPLVASRLRESVYAIQKSVRQGEKTTLTIHPLLEAPVDSLSSAAYDADHGRFQEVGCVDFVASISGK
jgi:hypothetical protein